MATINSVVLVGNLTKDPELRHTPAGMPVCSLRLAVNPRRKDSPTGHGGEQPNYLDIPVWGPPGGGLRSLRLGELAGQQDQDFRVDHCPLFLLPSV